MGRRETGLAKSVKMNLSFVNERNNKVESLQQKTRSIEIRKK